MISEARAILESQDGRHRRHAIVLAQRRGLNRIIACHPRTATSQPSVSRLDLQECARNEHSRPPGRTTRSDTPTDAQIDFTDMERFWIWAEVRTQMLGFGQCVKDE